MKILDLVQGTPEWHEWRRRVIGATDTTAILGLSPYKTQRDVMSEKLGLGEAAEEGKEFIFARGHAAEEKMRTYINAAFKKDFKPACVEADNGYQGASLDGLEQGFGICEMKYTGRKVVSDVQKHGVSAVPRHHLFQMYKGLSVSEQELAYYCIQDDKGNTHIQEIPRDEEQIKIINEYDFRFLKMWQEMKMPELTKADTLFVNDEKLISSARRLCELKQHMDTLKSEYETLEDILKQSAAHNKVAVGPLLITTYERAGSIDYGKIPELKVLGEKYLESFRKAPSLVKKFTFAGGAE